MNTDALSMTLIHFAWEGAAIAFLLAVFLCVTKSSRVRYAASVTALFAMPVCFAVTYWIALPPPISRVVLPWPLPLDLLPATGAVSSAPSSRAYPSIVTLWMAGVAILYAWRLSGWFAAQRLRRTGVCVAPEPWPASLAALARRLRLSRPVVLLESSLADAPLTIGVLRPAILMPVGILTGLPTAQVEAILLHELAHIRRFDYLVNLAQSLIEGLLFYHPAVWWVSRTVRAERECCCDDAVVSITGDAPAFARALSALEHYRARDVALAATGGDLMRRIHRLLGKPVRRAAPGPILAFFALAAASAFAAWQPEPAPTPLPEPAPAPVPSPQQPQPAVSSAPAPEFDELLYIATPEERAAFEAISSSERPAFIEQFWLRRDPTPGTAANEFRDEHYRRIAEANARFAEGATPGWRTLRGAFYVSIGPPDQIQPPPPGSTLGNPAATEIWRYAAVDGQRLDLWFSDQEQSGEYVLLRAVTPDLRRGPRVGRLLELLETQHPGGIAAPDGTQQVQLRRELEAPYIRWLDEEVRWIASDEERRAFETLAADAEREAFIEQFWQRRDPTPGTGVNELREEHYRRIAWANDRFASDALPGWKTDRGMVYIKFGAPDEREEHPVERYEVWRYRYLEGVGRDIIIEFVDRSGTNEYRMTWDPAEKDALLRVPGGGLSIYERLGLRPRP
jgi:GWxTD domain-containing protein